MRGVRRATADDVERVRGHETYRARDRAAEAAQAEREKENERIRRAHAEWTGRPL